MATRKEIQSALQHPYDRMLFSKQVLHPVFGSSFKLLESVQKPFVEPTKSENSVISQVLIYGTITLEDGTDITCYEVTLQPTVRIEQSKVAIQQYVRKLLISGQAALINFIAPKDKDIWRFTLVAKDSKITDEGIAETQTHPQRYTYLVEKDRPNRTMAERLETLSLESEINLEMLIKAFSVEAMSKAFFDEYKEHYQNFAEYLTGKRMVKQGGKWVEKQTGKASPFLASLFNGNEKDARDFIKKLMGRIVFLYFVQKKRWLGASSTEYNDGPYDFIFKLFDQTGGDERFFPVGLSELFFNALNKERKVDDWKMPSGKVVKIPYLNGGLFVRDEIDEKIHKKGDLLTFPPGLFSHVDKMDTPNDRGFLDFLNAYNFTVYEDSQDDHTVAVDPEMLGHIFENLLEDNKDKGAFYTPKEIVHYMCQESLIEYLSTNLAKEYKVYRQLDDDQVELFGNETRKGQLKMMEDLGDKALNRKEVEHIVKEKDIKNLSSVQLQRIDELLNTVKICDPAIGSGAFPMGLLQEIFSIKEASAYFLDKPFNAARTKENIISNSIYGVDIERGAVDIARLRFWLSLVVDEEKPKALPNLDYKIVVGNSLLSKFEDEIIEIDWDVEEGQQTTMFGNEQVLKRQDLLYKISQKQKQFFDPENIQNKADLKLEIRDLKIEILINQLVLMSNSTGQSESPTQGVNEKAAVYLKRTQAHLASIGWQKTINKLKLIQKNPKASFEHFDWRLDFPEILNPLVANENLGFDIVIANPPYLGEKGNKEIFQEISSTVWGRKHYKRRMDLFYFFFHLSLDLSKDNGTINFITTNYYPTATYANKLRADLKKRTEILSLIDFHEYRIFNSAKGQHNAITFLKKSKDRSRKALIINTTRTGDLNSKILLSILEGKDSETSRTSLTQNDLFFGSENYIKLKLDSGASSEAEIILEKMLNQHDHLYGDLVDLNQGIVSGTDKVTDKLIQDYPRIKMQKGDGIFIINETEKKDLCRANKEAEDFIKPIYKNSDLRKWKLNKKSNLYVIYVKDEGQSITLPLSLQEHFDKYKPILEAKKMNCFKNPWLKKIVEPWLNRGNYFVLFYPRDKKYFEQPKIVNSRRAKRNIFAYEAQSFYEQSDIVLANKRPSSPVSLKYLIALLNSKLYFIWLYNKGKRKGDQLELFQKPLSEIPIKIAKNPVAFEILVDEILQNNLSMNDQNLVSEKIDKLVYDLYNLSKSEIDLVEKLAK